MVPVAIQRLPNLLGFEIYNCTIPEWSKKAALLAAAHPCMTYVTLAFVNMTELPDGLLEPLTELLFDIEISITNLTTLSDDLHVRWHSLSVFYMEHAQLTAFPETLLKLDVYDLLLIGNRIKTLSDLLSLRTNYFVLELSQNSLRALPAAAADGLAIDFFALETTKLEALSEWMDACVGEIAYLPGSPLCTAGAAQEDQQQRTPLAGPDTTKFACDEVDPRGLERRPLEITQLIRIP